MRFLNPCNGNDDAIVRATDLQGSLELAAEKKTLEIATKMLDADLDVAIIAKTTDLSIDDIEELKKNL